MMGSERERAYFLNLYRDQCGIPNFQDFIEKRINNSFGEETVSQISKELNLYNKKILEIGSGWGNNLISLRKKTKYVYGLEPDSEKIKICKENFKKLKINDIEVEQAMGEQCGYKNNQFDIVILSSVIEHVSDHKKVYQEIWRILKPGGVLFLQYPNYASFFEHHYKINAFPFVFINKTIGTIYLRLKKRNPKFFQEEINPITYAQSDKMLLKIGFSLRRDLSKERQQEIVNNRKYLGKIISLILFRLKMQPSIITQFWEK